jgi:hypothetical protein
VQNSLHCSVHKLLFIQKWFWICVPASSDACRIVVMDSSHLICGKDLVLTHMEVLRYDIYNRLLTERRVMIVNTVCPFKHAPEYGS